MADYANSFDIDKFVKPFDIAKQAREGEDYVSSVSNYLKSFDSLPVAADKLSNELMIPQLRENALNLGDIGTNLAEQIRITPDLVSGTTRDSLVTAPQRQMMIEARQKPLLENLQGVSAAQQSAGNRLSSAENQLNTRLGLMQAEQERGLLPFEMGFSLLEQRQAREFSGYTFENQLELDRLIQNQQAGITLSEGERDRANRLALAEWSYRQHLDGIKESGSQARQTKKAPADLASIFSSIF